MTIGGKSPLDLERERAIAAEAALAAHLADDRDALEQRATGRSRRARRLANLLALLFAVALGYVFVQALGSDNPIIARVGAVLIAAGLTGWLAAASLRSLVARGLERLLMTIHAHT